MGSIADRLAAVRERIGRACERSGRAPQSVTLVAVTKQRTIAEIREVLSAGAVNIGENYVQEALAKHAELGSGPVWHFIGHLQRNKARDAVRLSDWIHSVDSLRLADELSRRAVAQGKRQRVLVEVNVSGEGTKSGVASDQLAALLESMRSLDGLAVEGLMTMAPWVDDAELVRPVFAETRRLAERCAAAGLLPHGAHLSMGMSSDFEVAVEEGATLVRVGTAIFGPREAAS